jgi:hypothetical protein
MVAGWEMLVFGLAAAIGIASPATAILLRQTL